RASPLTGPALAPRFRSGTTCGRSQIAPPPAKAPKAAACRAKPGRTSISPGRSAGSPPSATNEARIKQRFLRRRIEGADNPLLPGSRSDRCRKACAGQIPEPPLGLFDLCAIMDVECMAGVTGTIHHDLGCHFTHSELAA